MDGPSAYRLLRERGVELPVIFLTGHGDVPMSVRAMKAGAFDFLEKPIASEALIARVRAALELDERRHEQHTRQRQARERFAQLTSREREVLDRILAGKTAKVIGRELGISPRTIEVHRKHILLKTGTTNVLELDAMARLAIGEAPASGAAHPG
jgi:FixJ family two-component response regulator